MGKIGRYEVEAEIGRGAMGIVYRAHDPELHRTVALKTYTLPPGLDEERREEFRRRFRREAQAAAALSHPGIVTVHDTGEDPKTGLPFIAMEYVPGRSLAQVLRDEGPLPLARVRALAATLSDALAAAHAAGIVHRDIKPANILVHERDGSVKIADFGVARVPSSTLTQSGASLGSPAYMAPEQIRGKHVDGRADLFALAAILYEALCGARPFAGEEVSEVLYAVAHESPAPPGRLRVGLPPALDRFFERALAKDPDDRFPDGASLGRALEEAVSGRGDATPVEATVRDAILPTPEIDVASMRTGRRIAVGLGALGVAALVLGWLFAGAETAHLVLDAKSRVDGSLTLRVDGREVYTRPLQVPRPLESKKKGLFKKVAQTFTGEEYENFEALVEVRAGKREIQAEVRPARGDPYRSTVVVDLAPGETRKLKLVAGGNKGPSLSFRED